MRVCLILPPNPILENPSMQPPLGPLYLAAVLEAKGHQVKITDLRTEKIVLPEMIPQGTDLYGVSATTGEYNYAKEIAEILRQREPHAVRIIGGCHVTHLPVETLREMDYDLAVIGEGEETILEIADEMEPETIKGIAYREGENIVVNEERPLIKDLDTIPFPARHLLPNAFSPELYYGARYGSGEIATSLITERGCPYNCAYCANWDRKLRFRSVENVVEEVKLCIDRFNSRRFKIIDDEFGMGGERAFELMVALEPLGIHFRAATRSDVVNPKLLAAMKKAGLDEISYGVETADDEVLRRLNKRENIGDHVNAVMWAKALGIRVKTYLMVCLPYETWDTVQRVKDFMRMTKPDKWTLSTFIPYPGCDISKHPERYDVRIIERDYSKYWLYQDDPITENIGGADREELRQHRIELWNYLISESWR
jgi:anaerobic magnesium-protoporphyrin IX monomethyl ester cyclase